MKRFDQQTYISKKLSELVTEVRINGKLNMLHLHVISENFYVDFLNLIYGWNLKNMNGIQQNSEAIDLVDHSNKLVVQVSSTSTKNKVESSLKKLSDEYTGYTFKFVPISDDSGPLRKKTFNTPQYINFNKKEDILDIPFIMRQFMQLDPQKQRKIFNFIMDELGCTETEDMGKLRTNLAELVKILSNENLNDVKSEININKFEMINKIKYNMLKKSERTIDTFAVYYNVLTRIYMDFDREGKNTSMAVFENLYEKYDDLANNPPYENSDEIFNELINHVREFVEKSKNCPDVSLEELILYSKIIVVDAFMRCKVFKNPEGQKNVIAG